MTLRPARRKVFAFCAALFAVLSLFPSPATAQELRKVTLSFHWKAQAQWAGFYMAREKGFYRQNGLDVTLVPRRGRSDPLDLLMDKRIDFATHTLAAGLGFRSMSQPIVLVAQIFNRSSLMVVARRSEGINSVTDLSGKAVAFWDGYFRFSFRSFFNNQGVVHLHELPMGVTVTQFTNRQVAAVSAMDYNEYNLILNSPNVDRDDLIVFRLRDMGMDFPEDALYTTEAIAVAEPEICRALVSASLEGWKYARDNREETLSVIMREAGGSQNEPVTKEHQKWMLDSCLDSIFIPEGSGRRPGVLSRVDFAALYAFLRKNGQLRQAVAYDDFVRFSAVEKAR